MIRRREGHHGEQPGGEEADQDDQRPERLNEQQWHAANAGGRLVKERHHEANMRAQCAGRVEDDQREDGADDGHRQDDRLIVGVFWQEKRYLLVHLERLQAVVNVNVRPPEEGGDQTEEDGDGEQDDPRGDGGHKVNDKGGDEAAHQCHRPHDGHLLVGVADVTDDLLQWNVRGDEVVERVA